MKAELMAFGLGVALGSLIIKARNEAPTEDYDSQLAELISTESNMAAYVVPAWAVQDVNGARVAVYLAESGEEMLWV